MKSEATFLDARQSIFAMLTAPAAEATSRDTGVVILNSGTIHNVGPFGLFVDMGNTLAEHGFPVLRLDQTGKGESFAARRESSELETLVRDMRLAVEALQSRFGVSQVAIVGLCSGADHGLQVADKIPEVNALVMLDGWAPRDLNYYLSHYLPKLKRPGKVLRGLTRRVQKLGASTSSDDALLSDLAETTGRRWDQAAMKAEITQLCNKKVPVFAVYTGDADEYYSYEGQLSRALTSMGLDTSRVTEQFNKDAKHLYPLVFQRKNLVTSVTEWLGEVA